MLARDKTSGRFCAPKVDIALKVLRPPVTVQSGEVKKGAHRRYRNIATISAMSQMVSYSGKRQFSRSVVSAASKWIHSPGDVASTAGNDSIVRRSCVLVSTGNHAVSFEDDKELLLN